MDYKLNDFWINILDYDGPNLDSILLYKDDEIVNQPHPTRGLAIFYAIKTDDIDLFKTLLSFTKIDLNVEQFNASPVHFVAIVLSFHNPKFKHVDEMYRLLLKDERVNLNTKGGDGGYIVFDYIKSTDDIDSIKNFLKNPRLDLTVMNKDGETPIDYLCHVSNAEVVDEVLSGIDSDDLSQFINEGVLIAVKKNNLDMLQVLSRRDAISFRNMDNVLLFAFQFHKSEDIKKTLLYTEYVPINQTDSLGNTVLHLACQEKVDSDLLNLILQYPNIDINLKNKGGNTAWDLANEERYAEAAQKLLDVRNPNVIYSKYLFVTEQLTNLFPTVSFKFNSGSTSIEFQRENDTQGQFYEAVEVDDDMYRAFKEYLNFYNSQVIYNKNLSIHDRGTVIQYQFRGDRLVNNFLSSKMDYETNDTISRASEGLFRKILNAAENHDERFPLAEQYIQKYGELPDTYTDIPFHRLLELTGMFAKDLSEIITSAPSCKLPVYAWRGLKTKFSRQTRAAKWEGFQSMTFNYRVTGHPFRVDLDSCCLYNIRIDPDIPMYFHMYCLTQESEIILDSSTTYEISPIEYLDIKRYEKKKIDIYKTGIELLKVKKRFKRQRI